MTTETELLFANMEKQAIAHWKSIWSSLNKTTFMPEIFEFDADHKFYYWRGNEITKEEYDKIINLKAFL